ncbi:hypothetical protein F1C58_08385 [Glaciihabitans sp. INWT7]|uniref:hypothetical protein n=1 Tax=Glaciihabitans sp. INWT7 TaxID=2596912 RepID=UPI0016259B36|nr:hypothetical protein [Glaciihabitans sp. INWT7]QNE46918.1 hypothetical protein F1C58_08385 [Glaciihabitans sp. INWT7]
MTLSTDELSAKARLAAMEAAAIAGQQVEPAALAEARERVTLAALWAKGREQRARERQSAADLVRQGEAKAEVAALFAEHSEDSLRAYDSAVAALENLVGVIDGENARIDTAAAILRTAGVPRSNWDRSQQEGFDSANFVQEEQGGSATSVIVDGVGHGREIAASWVAAAVCAVAAANRGLPFPYGGNLENATRHDVPAAIKNRDAT